MPNGQLHLQAATGIFLPENLRLTFSNAIGQTVLTVPFAAKVDVAGLGPGLYFIQIQVGEGRVLQVEKIVMGN